MEDNVPRLESTGDLLNCRDEAIHALVRSRALRVLEEKRSLLNNILASLVVGTGSWMSKHQIKELQAEIVFLEGVLPLPCWDKHADYLLREIQTLPKEARERVMLHLKVGLDESPVDTNTPVQVRLTPNERIALETIARIRESSISALVQQAITLAHESQDLQELTKGIHSLDKKVFARLPLSVHRRLNVLIHKSGMTPSKVLRSAIVGMLRTHGYLK